MADREMEAALIDDLAALVDGDEAAIARHADALASSDELRDLRHDAKRVADELADAGADYEPPADLESRVLAAIDGGTVRSSATRVIGEMPSPPAVGSDTVVDPSATAGMTVVDAPASAATLPGTSDTAVDAAPPTVAEPAAPTVDDRPAARPFTPMTSPTASMPSASGASADAKPAAKKASKAAPAAVVFLFGGALAVAATAVIGFLAYQALSDSDEGTVATTSPGSGAISGRIARVVRAAADDQPGISIQIPGAEAFSPATAGAHLAPGSIVRTDERTRAEIELSDGSVIVLNHQTEVELDDAEPRRVSLTRGELVAEVAHLEQGPHATYATRVGHVEVLGTKFILTSTDDVATVRVVRGEVRFHAKDGRSVDVKAGQEGALSANAAPSVEAFTGIASELGWSELEPKNEEEDVPLPGLGELRARRPGEREERERPLHLANHQVTVRIVGNVARTEIEETFRNDDDATLEGIYKFPLPADARIASLALEVDGRWEEGAFVEKDHARQIWRGVIRNATPVAQREVEEEFIWVPGPWRDPALLEWQRGGRFELRIFPIPARGERRIRLAYTQTIAPHGGGRRYVYPLAHAEDESTRVGRFSVDVRIANADDGDVRSRGYDMTHARDGNASTLRYAEDSFVPAGDLIVDYRLPSDEAELRWWTFRGEATVQPPAQSREVSANVLNAWRQLHGDQRPYVAFALRPDLPAWVESQQRDYVIVVDSSQSMVGERYQRATRLAEAIVSEMDRRDRVVVVACDLTCRAMDTTAVPPTGRTAERVRKWLEDIRPAGSSDIARNLRDASEIARRAGDGRDRRILYVGDGLATTGYRGPGAIAAEVAALAQEPGTSFTTVGIGGDADARVLAAIARSGGGHYVPYVPGQRAEAAALAVLETTYGVSLEDPQITFPEGVADIAPARVPTVRAGEEVIVVGRLTGDAVRGWVTLRGKVGGREFTQRYPVELDVSTAAGNSFVPRLWASKTIEESEVASVRLDRDRSVAMSKAFGVLSPETSLLVLESAAMFQAFGVDRTAPAAQWTGEEDMELGEVGGVEQYADSASIGTGGLGTIGHGAGGGAAGYGRGGGLARPRASARATTRNRGPIATSEGGGDFAEAEAPAREERAAPGRVTAAAEPAAQAAAATPPPPPADDAMRRPGRWMRRVWYREGSIATTTNVSARDQAAVTTAEQALREQPDSRDRHRALVRALSRAGNLERATEIAEKWLERDRLDAEALTYLSDALGRRGDREEALRLLTGIVDLSPEDKTLHERLANAFERAGKTAEACSHRIAISELSPGDQAALAGAIRCERSLGRGPAAERLLGSAPEASRTAVSDLAARAVEQPRLRGDLVARATWSAPVDLDVTLVTPQGTRLSWMGGRVNVLGRDASQNGRETLALRRATVGSYVVEVSRTSLDDATPVSGQIELEVLGTRRTIPFRLAGEQRTTVGRVEVVRRSRMEPVW